jgi:hypothetical protein
MNKKIIIRELTKRKDKLRKRGVRRIGLFGSYLKGTQQRGSDIDFIVSMDDVNIADNYFELLFYFENLFKRKIDLIIDKSLRKELNYVRKEAVYVKI